MGSAQLIQALARAGLDGTVVGSHHPSYERYRRVWNGVIDRRPAAIVQARSVTDVTRTIQVAAESRSLLAVRCGGHSFPGFSTCDDGIVLDLSSMNRVVIDRAGCTAEVAGGSLLGHLDRAAVPHGLVTPAGVVSHTGAAGLTLGGGMGWLSRGVIRHTILFDTLGDSTPGGVFLGETDTVVHGPHPGFADDFPFCEIAAQLTGA